MIFLNKEKNECVITCGCGCMEGVSIHIDKEDGDFYCFGHLMDTQWNINQYGLFWRLKKIWYILRGKDYYYSELIMNKKEFEQFKEFINQF